MNKREFKIALSKLCNESYDKGMIINLVIEALDEQIELEKKFQKEQKRSEMFY